MSQTFGTSSNPEICDTHDGSSEFLDFQIESIIDFTLHIVVHAIKISFFFNVQVFIKTVATGQWDLSKCDSTTVQIALRFGFAFNSNISESKNTVSSKSSIHCQCLAETQTHGISHHQSSTISQISASSHLTLSMFAHWTSVLLIATTIETHASLA